MCINITEYCFLTATVFKQQKQILLKKRNKKYTVTNIYIQKIPQWL